MRWSLSPQVVNSVETSLRANLLFSPFSALRSTHWPLCSKGLTPSTIASHTPMTPSARWQTRSPTGTSWPPPWPPSPLRFETCHIGSAQHLCRIDLHPPQPIRHLPHPPRPRDPISKKLPCVRYGAVAS